MQIPKGHSVAIFNFNYLKLLGIDSHTHYKLEMQVSLFKGLTPYTYEQGKMVVE